MRAEGYSRLVHGVNLFPCQDGGWKAHFAEDQSSSPARRSTCVVLQPGPSRTDSMVHVNRGRKAVLLQNRKGDSVGAAVAVHAFGRRVSRQSRRGPPVGGWRHPTQLWLSGRRAGKPVGLQCESIGHRHSPTSAPSGWRCQSSKATRYQRISP